MAAACSRDSSGNLSQARHGHAMAAFGIGILLTPILGPTLGGWITDNYSWRWIFYLNQPVGVLSRS